MSGNASNSRVALVSKEERIDQCQNMASLPVTSAVPQMLHTTLSYFRQPQVQLADGIG